MINVGLL